MNLQSPIYVTGVSTDGKFLLGGIFKMQDQIGFPIDASFEECRNNGCQIDWLEAMADCWLNDCLKFDSFSRQAELLTSVKLKEKFKEAGAVILARFPKMKNTFSPVDTVCKYVLAMKRLNRWNPSH
jgi:hypothetical protein